MKKILCFILAMMMVLSCVGVMAEETAETTETVEVVSPVEADELTLEASIAIGLGAIAEYIPDKKVTVADMALAAKALEPSGYVSERYFSQASYTSEVKLVTAEAVMLDILGYSIFFDDGKIDANDEVTIKSIASKYDISKSSKPGNETITMQELAELIYNTMKASSVETVYSAAGNKSQLTKTPYMERVLGMNIIYGVVQSTAYSSIVNFEGTDADYVVIDGVSYYCEQGAYEDFIGMQVAALVKNEDNQLHILSMYDYKNNVLELSADMLNNHKTRIDSIAYWENDRSKDAKLSGTVDVLYNYSLYQDYTVEDFKLNQGRLVLIDNDGNRSYDVVKIEKYTSFEVLSVSMDRKTVGDSYGNLFDISDLIENEWPVIENGKVILPQNIPSKSIATCFTNKAGQVVRLYIDNTKAAGMLQRFEEKENKVILEEKEYRYVNEIKAKLEAAPKGALLTVKLNHYGEIAYFEISGDAVSYGYMVAFTGAGNPFDPIKIKMYTQTAELTVFDVAETIKFNGVKMASQDAFSYNLESGLWDEAGAISQVVTYKRNSRGEITAINTPMSEDDGNKDRLLKYKDGVFTYFSNPRTICSDVRLKDTSKVFIIPTDLSLPARYYKYGSYNILGNDSDYTCQIYNVDEDYYADCVVIRRDPMGWNSINELGGSVYMVCGVGEAIGDEEQLTTMIKVRNLGETTDTYKELIFINSDVATTFQGRGIKVSDLRPGDIIMAETAVGAVGYATIKVLYRSGDTEPYEEVKCVWYTPVNKDSFYGDSNTYAAGVIKKVIKDGCIAKFKPETEEFEGWDRVITFGGNLSVYICEVENDKLYRGSVADLQKGDTVFALMNAGNMKEFVIYR